MFDFEEKNVTSVFQLVVRASYLVAAVAMDVGFFYIDLFPGIGRDQMFERGMIGILLFMATLVICVPPLLIVIWKTAKRERPIFWMIALFIAALPLFRMISAIIFDFVTM